MAIIGQLISVQGRINCRGWVWSACSLWRQSRGWTWRAVTLPMNWAGLDALGCPGCCKQPYCSLAETDLFLSLEPPPRSKATPPRQATPSSGCQSQASAWSSSLKAAACFYGCRLQTWSKILFALGFYWRPRWNALCCSCHLGIACCCWSIGGRLWPCLTGWVQARPDWQHFYENEQAQCLRLLVWTRHLQKGIDLSNRGDKLRHKGLQPCIKLMENWSVSSCMQAYLWIDLNSSLSSALIGRLEYCAG